MMNVEVEYFGTQILNQKSLIGIRYSKEYILNFIRYKNSMEFQSIIIILYFFRIMRNVVPLDDELFTYIFPL